jgi:integrase
MGLGAVHTFNLKEARDLARQQRQLLRSGKDPLAVRRDVAAVEKIAAAKRVTFRQCAEEFLRTSPVAKTWTNDTHRKQWRQTLEDYAFPTLGDVSVGDIDVALIKKTLAPLWARHPATASRLRGRIEFVLAYATASGLREGDNPAAWRGNLKAIFGKVPQQKHHPALAYSELPAFMERLRAVNTLPARAVEFMILTAVRLSEARNATWDEINLADKVWTIPAERMKGNREHRVPLAPAVCDLLDSLPRAGELCSDSRAIRSMRWSRRSTLTLRLTDSEAPSAPGLLSAPAIQRP